eukprot:5596552-Pleurochrysis_carterae.AAC.3
MMVSTCIGDSGVSASQMLSRRLGARVHSEPLRAKELFSFPSPSRARAPTRVRVASRPFATTRWSTSRDVTMPAKRVRTASKGGEGEG